MEQIRLDNQLPVKKTDHTSKRGPAQVENR